MLGQINNLEARRRISALSDRLLAVESITGPQDDARTILGRMSAVAFVGPDAGAPPPTLEAAIAAMDRAITQLERRIVVPKAAGAMPPTPSPGGISLGLDVALGLAGGAAFWFAVLRGRSGAMGELSRDELRIFMRRARGRRVFMRQCDADRSNCVDIDNFALDEILRDNAETLDPDEAQELLALSVGDRWETGGGAAPITILERVRAR